MAVYLGTNGHIELKRDSFRQALITDLDPFDVNVERRRFSVNFAEGALITGDQVDIATADGSPLELVADHVDENGDYFPDWRGYIYIDDAGGIRLYDSFEKSLQGNRNLALELVQPTETKRIGISTRSGAYRCLSQVSSFELSTGRDEIDITALGAEFRDIYEAGLMSGQGRIECFWEHKYGEEYKLEDLSMNVEFPAYLARLVLRLQQGSDFEGRFYIYTGENPSEDPSVWYEAECVVTNVSVAVEPTQIITTSIDFVTSGAIVLHQGIPPAYILQEDTALILLESNQDGALLQEDPN